MKLFISTLLVLVCHVALAADPKGDHQDGAKHKDWNEVFKQPVSNLQLSEIPAKTQLLEPAFLAPVTGTEVTLKWKPVENVKYHLQVATDANFKWLVVNEHLVDYTEYNLKNLQSKQQYFWRVYTFKQGNKLGYSKSLSASSSFETVE